MRWQRLGRNMYLLIPGRPDKHVLQQLKTQTQTYWQDEFAVTNRDLEFLYSLLIETGLPLNVSQIARAIIEQRQDEEFNWVRANLRRGKPYQPQGIYQVGDGLVFPVLDGAYGVVVADRPGYNPAYGAFNVIEVQVEGENKTREYAARLQTEHKLNLGDSVEHILSDISSASADEIFARYGSLVEGKVEAGLAKVETLDFVRFEHEWYLKGLLADVHVGLRNIIEAVLDVSGTSISSEELLKQIELPPEIRPEAQLFSLNYALAGDERFDNVGTEDQVLWFLRRMEPPEALLPPRRLLTRPDDYDRAGLNEELLRFERELDDELSAIDLTAGEILESPTVSFVLTYPHRRVGTIPLTQRVRKLFPKGTTQHTRITLVDGQNGNHIPGWMSHEYRYISGLDEWYRRNSILVGAYITLERTSDPFKVVINFIPKRERREWIRVARAEGGRLHFEMKKQPTRCEYDELMVVGEDNADEVDALWVQAEEDQLSVEEILNDTMPELAKLSPQGTVHAKTVYSAMNIIRRCPPGRVFAALAESPNLKSVGGGYWTLEEPAG
jgi:hypothetical protein